MQWQADQEAARQAREGGDAKSDEETGPDETPSENGDGGERMVTHFSAWIEVDPVRAGREASTIADEVLSQFTDRGKRVKVTVEIEADDPEGFDENVRRVVTENAKTLGFGHHEFI